MPGRDRKGPMGMGAMTGRAAGYCAGYGRDADTRGAGQPRRRRMGRECGATGFGPGRRRWFSAMPWTRRFGFRGGMADAYQAPNPESEEQALMREAEALKAELEMIQKRLARMEKDTAST